MKKIQPFGGRPARLGSHSKRAKHLSLLTAAAAGLFGCSSVLAGNNVITGTKDQLAPQASSDNAYPLDTLEIESSYVASSRLKDSGASGQRYGRQDEFAGEISYTRRIPLGLLEKRLYLDLGGEYSRFDFGVSNAQVPTTLQGAAGVIGLEYMIEGHAAVFLRSTPGVYFANEHVTTRSFDAPTILAGAIPLTRNFRLLLGVRASLLSQNPVLPVGGFIWDITSKLSANIIAPAPRLIYQFNKQFSAFVGGELVGGSFVRGDSPTVRGRINHAVLDYSEYRGGAGLSINLRQGIAFDLSGGYDFQRKFDYYRPGVDYRTKSGAPYAQVNLHAEF